ncbi:beta-ketoacyl synthase N-terminal-like domain-containing protein [Streptomyces tropicalis]|uniref:Beta-ketoacyl synthase N-terminal-like domain-containing protein n=1 Tax=Streptomyces tropicalis TaxID=3034234 RepID=A0ABT6A3V8_9ACTN|nr:beta-ketoacyl synthase N-terminal-like domain-containing protein [Streptomyces tropicalis]MDF3299076.1 beta-ketoacyl synthase N-terminal-like domain-containing protein [Streptomyces tropicalis]
MFEFSLGPVTLCAPGPTNRMDDPEVLPPDWHEVIGTAGDQFRDAFTRTCLYLVLGAADASGARADGGTRTDDTVVIGTEYGNTAALARLQRQAAEKGKLLSAQYFPNATSSSASAFVNLRVGATGRNMTINAGVLTPVVALWQALSALDRGRSDVGRLLVGDVYAPEAVADARLDTSDAPCRDGVAHAFLHTGAELTAEFDFGAADAPQPGLTRTVRKTAGRSADGAAPVAFAERNGAFATRAFLDLVHTLEPTERAVLECRAPDGRHAGVTVTRQHANSTDRRSL